MRRRAVHGPTREPEGGTAASGRGPCGSGAGQGICVVAVVDPDGAQPDGRVLGLWAAEWAADFPLRALRTVISALRGGPALPVALSNKRLFYAASVHWLRLESRP